MKKVRILQEIPFGKKGLVFNVDECIFSENSIKNLVDKGYFEYIEEDKDLEEKLNSEFNTQTSRWVIHPKSIARIAKDHYLEAFDMAVSYERPKFDYRDMVYISRIRKSLENA